MVSLKCVYVTLFTFTAVKCFTKTAEEASYNAITKEPDVQVNSTIKTTDTLQSMNETNSLEENSNKSKMQWADQNSERKRHFRKSMLIVSKFGDLGPRRNWGQHYPKSRGRHKIGRKGRAKGRPKGRAVGRSGANIRKGTKFKKAAQPTKKENTTEPKILWFQEYDDQGNLINNVTIKNLDDVISFFSLYLGVHVCYEDVCDNISLPTKNATLEHVTSKHMYYEFKVFNANGSFSVLETSTKWIT